MITIDATAFLNALTVKLDAAQLEVERCSAAAKAAPANDIRAQIATVADHANACGVFAGLGLAVEALSAQLKGVSGG